MSSDILYYLIVHTPFVCLNMSIGGIRACVSGTVNNSALLDFESFKKFRSIEKNKTYLDQNFDVRLRWDGGRRALPAVLFCFGKKVIVQRVKFHIPLFQIISTIASCIAFPCHLHVCPLSSSKQ